MGCLLPVRVMREQKNILKTKYGRLSEVANAHIQSNTRLPVITGTNPARIRELYEKLVTSIQTLESMGKEKEIRLCYTYFRQIIRHPSRPCETR